MTKLEQAAKDFAEASAEAKRCATEYDRLEEEEGAWEDRKAQAYQRQHAAAERRRQARDVLIAVAAEWKP